MARIDKSASRTLFISSEWINYRITVRQLRDFVHALDENNISDDVQVSHDHLTGGLSNCMRSLSVSVREDVPYDCAHGKGEDANPTTE